MKTCCRATVQQCPGCETGALRFRWTIFQGTGGYAPRGGDCERGLMEEAEVVGDNRRWRWLLGADVGD